MDHPKGMRIAIGLSICLGYCIGYLFLRYYSFDQWFLPAGLRAVCLFFLPIRYWPLVFIGDAAAVMYGRIPLANGENEIWVYFGPFALIVGTSIAPYLLRKKLTTVQAIAHRLPMAAAGLAAWGGVCTVGLNATLGGPDENATLAFFTTKFFGNYLGALMGMLPVLVWINRQQRIGALKKTVRDAVLAAISIAMMFAYLEYWPTVDDMGRKSVLLLMIFPALFLTYYHGWLGAAIGVVLVNVGIAQTMTYMRTPGAPVPYDETVFLAQIGLSIAASAFLILGTRITSHYDMAVDSGVAEEEARKISRLTLLSSESQSRNQVLYMAQLHVLVDDEMRELVDWLKTHGKYTEALAINKTAARHRQLFNTHALAFYPIDIEEKGLFAVVQSQAFEDRWSAGIPIAIRFDDGDPKALSNALQFAAYHCLCSAIVLMCDWKPEELHIRMRVLRTSRRRGIYFSICAFNPGEAQVSQAGTAASLLLNARASAHGGIVRRHAHRIGLWLAEPVEDSAADQ
ncbi:MAG: MASE1 domain-containing protein [Pseudomonadota bacterium]